MRAGAFVAWAAIGTVLSYGLLYVLTPFGALIVGSCLIAAVGLSWITGRRWPQVLGLAAGPGAFCLVIAASVSEPVPWSVAGAGIIATVCGTYLHTMRDRCARG